MSENETAETRGDERVELIVADTNNDGKPDLWVVDTDGDGKADVFQFDHDGDGQVDLTIIDRTQDGNPDEIVKGDAGLPACQRQATGAGSQKRSDAGARPAARARTLRQRRGQAPPTHGSQAEADRPAPRDSTATTVTRWPERADGRGRPGGQAQRQQVVAADQHLPPATGHLGRRVARDRHRQPGLRPLQSPHRPAAGPAQPQPGLAAGRESPHRRHQRPDLVRRGDPRVGQRGQHRRVVVGLAAARPRRSARTPTSSAGMPFTSSTPTTPTTP